MATQAWFESWFDSPYYHILYADRDQQEAQRFIDKLMTTLDLPKNARLLDVACGRGRHAIYLNQLGYDVKGIDLSQKNISHAQSYANHRLQFQQHDMRKTLDEKFDGVLNLFTSFGYFEDDADSLKALYAFRSHLQVGGVGVIDFLNTPWVAKHLIPEESIIKEGIQFDIKRRVDARWITKEIAFETGGEKFQFQERVRALHLEDFTHWLSEVGLEIKAIYGDYTLSDYNPLSSSRLILIVQ